MVPTHMHSDNNRNNASHLFLFAFKHSYSKNTNTPPYQNPPARVSTREERRGVRVGVSPLNFHIALVTAIHHARKTIQTRKRATKDETDENSTIQQLAKINKGIEKQKTTRLVYARTRCPPCLPACLPPPSPSLTGHISHTNTRQTQPHPLLPSLSLPALPSIHHHRRRCRLPCHPPSHQKPKNVLCSRRYHPVLGGKERQFSCCLGTNEKKRQREKEKRADREEEEERKQEFHTRFKNTNRQRDSLLNKIFFPPLPR